MVLSEWLDRAVAARPWEPLGMTTERWRLEVPVRLVNIDRLIPTQLRLGPSDVPADDAFPHVVVWEGRCYVSDGHNRIAHAIESGADFILARVLEIS